MKAIESFSVSESFGVKDLSLEEIENINGGATANVGECLNFNTGELTGAIVPTVPPIGPSTSPSIGGNGGGK